MLVSSRRIVLTTASSRDDMPYTNYMVHETLRWMPVSPLGVPHKSVEEDVYRGMVIPKVTTSIYYRLPSLS